MLYLERCFCDPWSLLPLTKHITRGYDTPILGFSLTAKGEKMKTKFTPLDLAHIALVAAIYVILTITPPFSLFASGNYQFRVSEMLNFMPFYNPKYIWGVTLGCVLANLLTLGAIDAIVGGGSTLIFVSLGVYLFKKYQEETLFNGWINKAFLYFAVFFSLSMFTIALELVYLFGAPFWLTWFTVAVGEFASLIVGGLLMFQIGKRIDLTR